MDWPWKENPEHFKKYLPKAIKRYVFNVFCTLVYNNIIGLVRPVSFDAAEKPTFTVFVTHFMLCLVLEDFCTYWHHRFLHHPYLYSKIHKEHHEFYNVIHVTAISAHWFEYLFVNYIPLYMGLFVMGQRIHLMTVTAFVWYRVLKTHDNHCGYEFPYTVFNFVPFATDSLFHNLHHLKNTGNYGSFLNIWDTIFGTEDVSSKEVL